MTSRLLYSGILAAIAAGASGSGCGGTTDDNKQQPTGNVCAQGGTAQQTCYTHDMLVSEVRYPYSGGGLVPGDSAAPVPRTDAEVAALFLPNGCLPPNLLHDGCCNPAAAGPVTNGAQCCYTFCTGACCGRPLFVGGEARLAPAVPRSDWTAPLDSAGVVRATVGLTGAIADAWLRDALFEHASVASFSRFALDLMAIGAPPELLAEAHRAALDEIEHARACFALAARYGGTAMGPGPLDLRGAGVATDLAGAVVAAIHEGCVGETIAALTAEVQLTGARDPEVRRVLETIAADEARHSALAYRFVAWALSSHPEIHSVIEQAFDEALAATGEGEPTRLSDEDRALFRAAGRLDAAERRDVARSARRELLPAARDALLAVRDLFNCDRAGGGQLPFQAHGRPEHAPP